jgi:hypothetical protein
VAKPARNEGPGAGAEPARAKRSRAPQPGVPLAAPQVPDPNEEVVVRPYMRGTLALLSAMPADCPIDEAGLARAVGRRSAGWGRFVAQLQELRLADDVALDCQPLLLATPAGLVLREQLCRQKRPAAAKAPTLIERLGLEPLAMLETLAELGPLRLVDVLAACHHLPGNNREPPLARSRFQGLTRKARLVEVVPGDELLEPALRRYRVTDAAWRIVAARRRLHPAAYDLTAFAACLAARHLPAGGRDGVPLATPLRRRPRRRPPIPGQLSLF